MELMQRLETCKGQLSALDSRLIIEACNRSLPKGSAAKDVVPFLRQTLGLSRYDASVRVKITPRTRPSTPHPIGAPSTARAHHGPVPRNTYSQRGIH
ncbi:hypothetical protein [Nocardia niigatensis]